MPIPYMGGKRRIAPAIRAHLMFMVPDKNVTYWEPFLGGGSSFEIIAPMFARAMGSDIHEDLMLMWQAVLDGWNPPTEVSEEEYQAVRRQEPSPLRGFVGFGCSFGGKWFGGYAREREGYNYATGSAGSVRKFRERLKGIDARLSLRDYRSIIPTPGDVVYCDPPYADATGYKSTFNHDEFWSWAENLARQGVHVLVSEYNAPEGWESIIEVDVNVNINAETPDRRLEKVFVCNP